MSLPCERSVAASRSSTTTAWSFAFDLGDQLIQVTSDIVPFAEDRPGFDADSQVLEGPNDVRDAVGVRREWKVRNKTKDELRGRE